MTVVAAAERLRNLGFLLKDVTRLYVRYFERRARELQLTLTECKVLGISRATRASARRGWPRLTETDPMTLVRTLDRMQQDSGSSVGPTRSIGARIGCTCARPPNPIIDAHLEDCRADAQRGARGLESERARATDRTARARAQHAVRARGASEEASMDAEVTVNDSVDATCVRALESMSRRRSGERCGVGPRCAGRSWLAGVLRGAGAGAAGTTSPPAATSRPTIPRCRRRRLRSAPTWPAAWSRLDVHDNQLRAARGGAVPPR